MKKTYSLDTNIPSIELSNELKLTTVRNLARTRLNMSMFKIRWQAMSKPEATSRFAATSDHADPRSRHDA